MGVPPDTVAAAAANAQASIKPDLTTHLIRYLGLLAQAVTVGALVFRWLVWLPALVDFEANLSGVLGEQRRALALLADVLRVALIIGVLGALYLQARLAGVLFWQLFPTRWGVIWIVRALAAFLAAGWMESLLLADQPRQAWLGLGLGATLLVTTVLISHSSAKPSLAAPLADATHLLATSVWAGGLVMLGLTLLSLRALDGEARRSDHSLFGRGRGQRGADRRLWAGLEPGSG